jgi:glucuronate isomerase
MAFISANFLLQNETARRLYRTRAAEQPILDYHSHMSPADIAEDRRFRNLYELWLEGDHYKWRAMRANGIAEPYCSGEADPYEKFLAWARTVPQTLRNPLYHWTHLELRRYFGIEELLDESTAPQIWRRANEQLESEERTTRGILARFRVRAICTTDDPSDSLEHHRRIALSGLPTRVYPAFRPDPVLRTEDPVTFNAWLDRLGAAAGLSISSLADLLQALRKRHDDFHQSGCRLSDHGLNRCYFDFCSEREASRIFVKVRSGASLDPVESEKFASFLMLFFGNLDAEKGWTKQLHLGALRNVNRRAHCQLGRDSGHDSIGDWPQAEALAAYLDRLDRENALPKIILYNLNPADNYVFAAMAGSFQDGKIAGKIQFGSGWWFLDQKEGVEWQINALSSTGLLSNFIGMLTDSRSWMSFPRHEYFRRVLCNLLGGEMEAGLLPDDEDLVGTLISNICFANAANYLGLDLEESTVGFQVNGERTDGMGVAAAKGADRRT